MKRNINLGFRLFDNLNFKVVINILFSILTVDLCIIAIGAFSRNQKLFSLEIGTNIINFGLGIAFIVVLLIFLFFMYISKSVNEITNYAKTLSIGNLSVNDIKVQGNNDFSILAEAINHMKSNIIFFIDNTKNNVIVLSDSIENILKSMNVTYEGNTEIASKIEEISDKSLKQLDIVKESVEKTNDINKSIDSISEHIEDVKNISSDTNLVSTNGKEILNAFNENMNLISKSVGDTEEFISKLKLSAYEIGNVVNFIVRLSQQLKMLSLNASIEANRAGEAGKGFAVVANEIIKLSDYTKDSIDKINNIVTSILSNSNDLETSIKNSVNNFGKGNEIFINIREVFSEINKRNESLLNQVNSIVIEMSNINFNTNSSVKLIEKVNEISEEVSQNTEESVAVIQEELAEFQQVNAAMSILQSLLTKIENLTNKFELDIKPINENPRKPLKIAIVLPVFGDVWDIIRFGILYGSKILKARNTTVKIIPLNSFSNEDFINTSKSIDECVENKYDGIIIPGFFEDQIKNALKIKIPIITFNVDIQSKHNRIAFVGQNSYESGKVAAKIMSEEIGAKGNILIITADKPYENMELRKKGFIDTIEKNKNINIVHILEIPFDNEKAYRIIKEYMNKNRNIHGIFNVAGGVGGLARAVEEGHMSKSLTTVVYDTTKDILEYINKGVITCTIGQDPFRQGYDPLIYLYNYLVKGEKPDSEKTWTKIEVINSSNVKHFLN